MHLWRMLPCACVSDVCVPAHASLTYASLRMRLWRMLPCACISDVCFPAHASRRMLPCACVSYPLSVISRVGQNRIYTPYMTVYLVISLPKIPYSIHHIWFWPTLVMSYEHVDSFLPEHGHHWSGAETHVCGQQNSCQDWERLKDIKARMDCQGLVLLAMNVNKNAKTRFAFVYSLHLWV